MKQPKRADLPSQGYHWVTTCRRETRPRLEVVYVHSRRDGDVDLYVFGRSLTLTWDEVQSWGEPMRPGPAPGAVADQQDLAPVRGHEGRMIPWALHVEAHSAYKQDRLSVASAEHVARGGGFTESELDRYAPDWRERSKPRSPGDHFPSVEEDEALALRNLIEERLVEIEQHDYCEVFDGEAVALRSYGNKLEGVVEGSARKTRAAGAVPR